MKDFEQNLTGSAAILEHNPFKGLDGHDYITAESLAAANNEWRERKCRDDSDFDRRAREGSSTSFELRMFSGITKIPNSSQ